MLNNQGFISIIVLLVMTIIIISAAVLAYTWNLEYLILNSSKNAIQASYLAESKIYMVLNKEEYFYLKLLPRIERYLKYGRLTPIYDYKIQIDKKDLIEGDQNKNIEISFSNDKRFMELKTHSTYDGIKKQAIAKTKLLNQFFDMGLPIVSKESIETNKLKDYYNYLDYLQKEINIPAYDDDLIGIEAKDYENIKIIKGIDEKINIEYFRNNLERPIKTQVLNGNKAFLIAKGENLNPPIVSILSENGIDKVVLNGILYIEGDLEIHNDVNFNGILIINDGELFINPLAEVKIEGIVLMKDHAESIESSDRIEIKFNSKEIIKYGTYLPKFIDPKIETMKIN
jgi:hypothetical protein